MLLNVNEFENRNQPVYDEVREYCKIENVNEE
jgi:hypothetical protein